MRCWILALLLGLPSLALRAQEGSADTPARFAKALKKLASDQVQVRESGSAEIAALPGEALRLVEAELKKNTLDLEIRTRLEGAVPGLKLKARKDAAARQKEAGLAWSRKTTIEAYLAVGRKDPKWDAKVRSALTLVARLWEGAGTMKEARQVYELCSEAVQAGCDDPLVHYARARMYDSAINQSLPDNVQLHVAAANAMKERGARYHELRQSFCFARAAELQSRSKKTLTEDDKKLVQGWLDLAVAHLGKGAADPEVQESALKEIGDLMTETWMKLTGDRRSGFDKVFEALTQARPESTLPLLLKGQVYTDYAWDARGKGWASSVTKEGWKKMYERLAEAETALMAAWKKNPDDPRAPTLMLGVELGQAKGREVLETWYKRAMAADPDNADACRKKMYYLEPKWHGSQEDMLAFGRELLAAGNWEARLPFQLVDAHLALAGYADKKETYYKDDRVWKDFQAVYEGYLKRHPDAIWDRTFYAKLACWCERWREAKALFDVLGDQAAVGAFESRAELDRFKSEAAAKGK